MKSFPVFTLVVFFIFSCNSQKVNLVPEIKAEQATKGQYSLVGKWTLEYMTPVNGKDVKQLFKIQKPYLNFVDSAKVAGNNGCNNIAGEYLSEENRIHFQTDKFLSTKMFCEGVDETAFLNALKTITGYDIINDGNKLVLLTGDIVSMSFIRAAK